MTCELYERDCLEILPRIKTASIDAVITDPPYVLLAHSSLQAGKMGVWADMMNAAYWYAAWYREVWRVLKPSGSFWTFCNWRSLVVSQKAMADAEIGLTSLLVWNKMIPGLGSRGLRPYYEMVAMAAKSDFKIRNRSIGDIWERKWQSSRGETAHPAEKPVDLLVKIMEICELPPGAVVLDPFMGSGTTGVAAMQCGLNFIGIEENTRWFVVAQTRIDRSTNGD